jgi:hypothetical protein
MSGHTPGPWALNTDGPFAYLNGNPNAACPWFKFASVVVRVNDEPCLEGEANARLIAAAPDSHEANRMFVRAVYVAHNIPSDASDEFIYDTIGTAMADAFFAARAAIAKATA